MTAIRCSPGDGTGSPKSPETGVCPAPRTIAAFKCVFSFRDSRGRHVFEPVGESHAMRQSRMLSWAAYKELARLRAGETVLVNGATGAAGLWRDCQIARHLR